MPRLACSRPVWCPLEVTGQEVREQGSLRQYGLLCSSRDFPPAYIIIKSFYCGLWISDCGLKHLINPQSAIHNPQFLVSLWFFSLCINTILYLIQFTYTVKLDHIGN